MKIAIDIRNIGKGRTGSEVVCFELVRHLALLDHDDTFHLIIDERDAKEYEHIAQRLGIEEKENFMIVPIGSGGKFSWTVWSVPQYCRKHNIDIYHTEYIIPFFMPAHTKIVTHIHDVSFRVHKELISFFDAFFLNLLIPYAVRKADRVIAVSEFTKNEIIKYYKVPENKVVVVLNAMSMECVDERRHPEIREKYRLPQKYVLMLGTMQPRKNIPFAIRAFAEIADQIPDVHLVLAGKRSHNFDKEIDRLVEQYPYVKKRIIFTGYVDERDKCAVYRMADLFIFPSLYEGFGVPILEAFSTGTPVIASSIPPHKEVAADTALYFDPRDIDQCKKILYDALVNDNMRENVVVAAKDREKLFRWEQSAKKLQEIYHSLT